MELTVCTGCSRHIRASEGRCPFCEAPARSHARTAVMAAMVVASGLTLAACYGGPPHPMPGPRTSADSMQTPPTGPQPAAQPTQPGQPTIAQ